MGKYLDQNSLAHLVNKVKSYSDRLFNGYLELTAAQKKRARENIGIYEMDQGTFYEIQYNVRIGKAPLMYPVGSQLVTNYTDPNNTSNVYDCPFDIVNYGTIVDEEGHEHNGMFLQAHYAMPLGVQFSQYQAFYYCENGLPAGTYYVTWGNSWGTHVVSGKSYQFTLTKPVPAGGQLAGFRGGPDQAPTNWRVYSYASNADVNPIETVTVSEGTEGTSLGTYYSNQKDNIHNAMQSFMYGYNRWSYSAIRQFLNKEGANWFVPTHNFDRVPDQYNKNAFIGGFDSDFKDVIAPIKIQTSANTLVDGGVTDVTYDKFFLPSLEQIYINPQIAGVEGSYWPYWKERTGAQSPQAQYGTYPERITYAIENHNSAQYVRLRSAGRGYSRDAWFVYSSGYVTSGGAVGAHRFAPACVIY